MEVSASQVKLGASNVVQCIEEMAVLCHELLTMDASDGDITHSINRFSRTVASKTRLWAPDRASNQIIECLRLARKHKPDLREPRFVLASSLHCRYFMAFVNDDYEEAASVFDESITSSSPEDDRDEFVAHAEELVTSLAMVRSLTHETPEYSKEAIYRARAFSGLSSVKGGFVAITEKQRFRNLGYIKGLEASSGPTIHRYPGQCQWSPLGSIAAIRKSTQRSRS